MKKAFNECYKAVLNCEDDTGRKRCELFKEVPDKRVSDTALRDEFRAHLYFNRNIRITTNSLNNPLPFPPSENASTAITTSRFSTSERICA